MNILYKRIKTGILVLFTSSLLIQTTVADETVVYKGKVSTEVNEKFNLGVSMKLLEGSDCSIIDAITIKFMNLNSDEDLDIQIYDDVSLSVVISLFDSTGKRLSKKPKRYTTAEKLLKKNISLAGGKELLWTFLMKDMFTNLYTADTDLAHITADIYVDVKQKNNKIPIEFHLREMNL